MTTATLYSIAMWLVWAGAVVGVIGSWVVGVGGYTGGYGEDPIRSLGLRGLTAGLAVASAGGLMAAVTYLGGLVHG
jgi:hypothetical protein